MSAPDPFDPAFNPPPLAMTMGEPGGIGSEIAFKAWQALKDKHEPGRPAFFLIDDPARLEKRAHLGNWPVEITTISKAEQATEAFSFALPVLPLKKGMTRDLLEITPGKARKNTAEAVIASVEQGVKLALDGAACGVVTNPIQKSALMQSGFAHPGHTEFLGELSKDAGLPKGMVRGPVMMLASPALRVVPVTIHTALKDVPGTLTTDLIVTRVTATAQSMMRDFGIKAPRIAMAGLNPHAGEAGGLGREEIDIISPAIKRLRQLGMNVFGPIPADSMFHEDARAQYDVAIAMYHDQGLIPIKTLSFFDAINITLGLPFVRTSPDHGTGLAIADKGVARPDSLIAAIYHADRIYRHRLVFDTQNA